jgi:hypothetical protein
VVEEKLATEGRKKEMQSQKDKTIHKNGKSQKPKVLISISWMIALSFLIVTVYLLDINFLCVPLRHSVPIQYSSLS